MMQKSSTVSKPSAMRHTSLRKRRYRHPKAWEASAFASREDRCALEWCSFRFHTITTDSTSAETLVATRAAMRLVYYRRLLQHNRIILLGPSPLFTDNDGVWYVARDAMATTRMLYVIRHVRMLQQAEYDGEITTFQVDGVLNPTDALTKWLQARTRVHHNLFLAGYPEAARRVWQASKAFATFKPKKITPVRLSKDAEVVLHEEATRTNLA